MKIIKSRKPVVRFVSTNLGGEASRGKVFNMNMRGSNQSSSKMFDTPVRGSRQSISNVFSSTLGEAQSANVRRATQ